MLCIGPAHAVVQCMKIRSFKGKITDNPKEMTTKQLENYLAWVEQTSDLYMREDGYVSAYERLMNQAGPYFEELERRSFLHPAELSVHEGGVK